MDFVIAEDYEGMSRLAADTVESYIDSFSDGCRSCTLGLATGATPEGMYADLVDDYKAGKVSFADVVTFNLDEYVGLAPEHDQSYRHFMQKHLFDHVDIDPANIHIPSGIDRDPEHVAVEYEALIAASGGIGLQVLGIGHNGHIGFNEPAKDFPVRTHLVDLTESTIQANSRYFASSADVPRQAYTMGIGTIMGAGRILLLASGEGKAEIIARSLLGTVTPECPASILRFHPSVTVVLDEAAAAKL